MINAQQNLPQAQAADADVTGIASPATQYQAPSDSGEPTFKIDAALNFANATQAYAVGIEKIRAGLTRIDCAQLSQFDSSALAVLLAWQREAQARDTKLTIVHFPAKLSSLAQAYGIAPLLLEETPKG